MGDARSWMEFWGLNLAVGGGVEGLLGSEECCVVLKSVRASGSSPT